MTETLQSAAPAKAKSRFPRSVPYIIGNEAAERFSFLWNALYTYTIFSKTIL
jgi:hypothetical protein